LKRHSRVSKVHKLSVCNGRFHSHFKKQSRRTRNIYHLCIAIAVESDREDTGDATVKDEGEY
jgi:hypothetical protein